MQILRALFYRAAEWGDYHGENPLRRVKFYREEQNLRPLTPEETTAIMAAARAISKNAKSPLQKCFADLCEFALNTGMRKSEILGLKWVDIRAGEAIIKGKGEKGRAVPLNQPAKAVVDRQDRGRPGEGAEFVFDIPNRQQPDLFRRTTFQISKAAKVPFNFHLLRHACATRMLERGADVVTISAILGHSRSMTTLLYSHTDATRKRKAVEALERNGSRP
jgi:integrase